jgi:hypothetical protein
MLLSRMSGLPLSACSLPAVPLSAGGPAGVSVVTDWDSGILGVTYLIPPIEAIQAREGVGPRSAGASQISASVTRKTSPMELLRLFCS